MSRVLPCLALLLAGAAGCKSDVKDDSGGDPSGGDTGNDTGPDTGLDTGHDPALDPPCRGGTWGYIDGDLVEYAIHVRATGDDEHTGEFGSPIATLEAALERTREDGAVKRIALGPGTYPAMLALDDQDDGLVIQGCGPDQVEIPASDAASPVILVSRTQDLRLEGFAVTGGSWSLTAWQGATLAVQALDVRGGLQAGVTLAFVQATLDEVNIEDTSAVAGTDGYGIGLSVQSSVVAVRGGSVTGSAGVGVLVDGSQSEVTLTGLLVSDTLGTLDDEGGRGIQYQNRASGVVQDCQLSGNRDVGLMAYQALDLVIEGVTVTGTAASGTGAGGDGIVITHGDADDVYMEPWLHAELTGNSVTGSSRAGVVLVGNGLDVVLDSNSIAGSGYDPSGSMAILVQGEPTVSGSDATYALGEPLY